MAKVESIEKLLVIIIKAIPYPEHIDEILDMDETGICFMWRGSKVNVSTDFFCTMNGEGNQSSILFEALLLRTYVSTIESSGMKNPVPK